MLSIIIRHAISGQHRKPRRYPWPAGRCCDEINCIVDAQGAHPLTFGPLPEPMQALTQQVKATNA
ncbi:hypothetical protein M8494_30190 [Serratia ureilytica]